LDIDAVQTEIPHRRKPLGMARSQDFLFLPAKMRIYPLTSENNL
jgi:hypothetical protein